MADHIQIGDISPRVQYTANGTLTSFTYPFPIFTATDIAIYLDGTLQTSGYTINGAGNSAGGTVDFDAAPANAVIVTLLRKMIIQRTTDFQESGEFRAKVINDELDKQVAMLQQVDEDVARSLQLSETDVAVDMSLPEKDSRKGKVLGFDPITGTPVVSTFSLADIEGGATSAAASAAAAALSEANAAASETAAISSETAAASSEAAAASSAADAAAAAAAVGGVKVSGDDTTPSDLEAKILAAGLASVSTQNPGANETRTIDVPVASQAEAEAGVATTKAMTPERTQQAIAALTTSEDQVARDNTIHNAFEIARIDGLSTYAMINTVIDAFTDETGVDIGMSTNETYDADGDYYHNPAVGSTSEVQIGQGVGMATEYSELTVGAWQAVGTTLIWDGTTSVAYASCPKTTVYQLSTSYPAYAGKDYGAGDRKVITGWKTWGSTDYQYEGHHHTNEHEFQLQGSDDDITYYNVGAAQTVQANDGAHSHLANGNTTPYRYWRLKFTNTVRTSGSNVVIAEIQFWGYDELIVPDMTLVSDTITAASAPDELRAIIDHEAVDATVINTDATLELSRDDGTTWTTATLVETIDQGGGRKTFAATVDVSGQPSGTSVKWRFKTLNNVGQKLHKIGIQADVQLTV